MMPQPQQHSLHAAGHGRVAHRAARRAACAPPRRRPPLAGRGGGKLCRSHTTQPKTSGALALSGSSPSPRSGRQLLPSFLLHGAAWPVAASLPEPRPRSAPVGRSLHRCDGRRPQKARASSGRRVGWLRTCTHSPALQCQAAPPQHSDLPRGGSSTSAGHMRSPHAKQTARFREDGWRGRHLQSCPGSPAPLWVRWPH